jgi:hypothetical protein
MTAMFFRSLALTSVLLGPTVAEAATPPRYLPAPSGKAYLMLFYSGMEYSEFAGSETATTVSRGVESTYQIETKYQVQAREIGLTGGYGLGSLPLIKAFDLSIHIPFYFREYDTPTYWNDKVLNPSTGAFIDTPRSSQGILKDSLHRSMKEGRGGKGIGDVTFSTIALLYSNPDAGAWVSSALKFTMANAPSARERFIQMLHGSGVDPSSGEGVNRLAPALTGIKTIAGQRAYLNVEYSLPLGQEKFTYHADRQLYTDGYTLYTDTDRDYEEMIKPGGVIFGTLGLDTNLKLWGINPGLEVNFRQMQKAVWKENGVDGTLFNPSPTTDGYPTHTPEFLRTAAWSVGNLPLKNNTEVEIALVATARMKSSETLKIWASYVSGTYGNSINVKFAYMTLFVEKPEDERLQKGELRVKEVEVAPVLEAPAAPSGNIRTAVAFPAGSPNMSLEEADWMGRQLRDAVKRQRGYDLVSEKEMAQLASEPCGDADCGARFGRALKVPAMVVSRLEKVGDPQDPAATTGFKLTVQLVGVDAGTAISSETIAGFKLDDLKTQLPGLLIRLTAPAPALPANQRN